MSSILAGSTKIKIMNKKDKNREQRKLILYRIALIISYVMSFISCLILVLVETPVDGCFGGMFFGIMVVSCISIFLFYILLDNQKKKTMNNSIAYYKQKLPFYGIQIFVVFLCFLFATIMNSESNTINLDFIFNFNIALTSLNFLVLTFIVPHMKERISQLMKTAKSKKDEIKGKIYNTIQKYNQSYTVVFISIILFFIYIFTCLANNHSTQKFYLLILLVYNSYVLIKLIVSIKTIFWINIKDVEEKLEEKKNQK